MRRLGWILLAFPLIELVGLIVLAGRIGGLAVLLWLIVSALACWTWFGLMNARLLRAGGQNASVWSAMLGVAVLPCALLLGGWAFATAPSQPLEAWLRLIAVSALTGVIGGWLASWLWNQASVRLPVTLVGQLIVVETLAGIAYGQLYTASWPAWPLLLGAALMVAGVVWALSAAKNA